MSDSADGKKYIGIDLGTTFCAMAYLDQHGQPVTIPNAEGELTTPSVVFFDQDGSVIVGREARRAGMTEPQRVADHVKRDIGQQYYHKKISGRLLSPPVISALILKKLRQDAEQKIGPIGGAVITVPAYFDEARRQATAAAGQIAGIKVLDIVNEPTAAALAYAFRDFINRGGTPGDKLAMAVAATAPHIAFVYDLGGGTLDVTVLRIAGDNLTVLATDGDVQLGGKDWDDRLVAYAAREYNSQFAGDLLRDPCACQYLALSAEETKKVLTLRARTTWLVGFGGHEVKLDMTRAQFEQITSDLLFRSESRVTRVLNQAKLTWPQVDEILLVGGSSRMPQIGEMIQRVSGKAPNKSLSPDEVVAHGAAIHAAIRVVDADLVRQKRADRSLHPTQKMPTRQILPDALPAGEEEPITLEMPSEEGELPELELIPEEEEELIELELADPATLFSEPVADKLRNVRTTNVNAHSLGVMVHDRYGREYNAKLIPRNTALPVSVTKQYGTICDNQGEVVVRVLEGESEKVEECITLGTCRIEQLPRGLPRGSPVEVTFTYDHSGRLHVSARELTSEQSAHTVIQRQSGMDDASLQKAEDAVERIMVG